MKKILNEWRQYLREGNLNVDVEDSGNLVEFFLFLDGERIGWLKSEKLYDDSDREIPETYIVDNVFIGESPESPHRGRGYGKHLYKYAIKWLFDNKDSRLVPGEYLSGELDPDSYTGTSASAKRVWKSLDDEEYIDQDYVINEGVKC